MSAAALRTLTVETLNVEGRKQLYTLARAVSDAAMGEIGTQLRYKCAWYGVDLFEADRWFASSKTCSGCGQVKTTLDLSQRTYRCDGTGLPGAQPGCGLVLDREVNAAINLARWPLLHSPDAKSRLAALAASAPPRPVPASLSAAT